MTGLSIYRICQTYQSFHCYSGGDIVKSFRNGSLTLHWKQLAQMRQVLYPNTSAIQGAYDNLSKAKLQETV